MLVNLDNLVIEVTRKCNMKCSHCLRGNAENKSMCETHMRDFLSQVRYIDCVTFTGGEPTLPSGIKAIEKFMEICNDIGIEVGNFYMVTNAKVWRSNLASLINRLYDFCVDNEISTIDISGDRYHESNGISIQNFKYRLEEELLYQYGIDGMVSIRPDIDPNYILSEGRGFYFGGKNNNLESILYYDEEEELQIREGTIYLNCDGQVIVGCDWSYESQKTREDIFLCMANDNLAHAILKYHLAEREEF